MTDIIRYYLYLLVKSKQEAEGIESKPEKKIVSKHLGTDHSFHIFKYL